MAKNKCKNILSSLCNVNFDSQKEQSLSAVDLSRKGSVDVPILDLVNWINNLADYYTTSSCSGRIVLFSLSSDKNKKKGTIWHFVSHAKVSLSELRNSLPPPSNVNKISNVNLPLNTNLCESDKNALSCLDEIENVNMITLKFEPFIVHIQCRNLETAKLLHQFVSEIGYKNSGLTIGSGGRVTLAVRSTLCLETPLQFDGYVVEDILLLKLIEIVNEKFVLNSKLHEKLFEKLKCNFIPV